MFFTALGVTAVLGGVTTWSAISMRSDPGKDKVRADCVNRGESCPTYQDALSVQRRTNVLLVATGVVGLGTGVLGALFTSWSGAPKATRSGTAGAKTVPTLELGQGVIVGAAGAF